MSLMEFFCIAILLIVNFEFDDNLVYFGPDINLFTIGNQSLGKLRGRVAERV